MTGEWWLAAGKRFAGHAVYHWDDNEAFVDLGMAEMCLRVSQGATAAEVADFEAEGLEPWQVPGEDDYECPHDALARNCGFSGDPLPDPGHQECNRAP